MTVKKHHEKLNYVEFCVTDMDATKQFFTQVFNWTFEDFGDDYTAFYGSGLDGGLYRASRSSIAEQGGALLVFYSEDINQTLEKVKAAGAEINKPIFSFPGGSRFHFIEPSGNELAVWTDKKS